MAKILNGIKIDFSEYFGEKRIFSFLNINKDEIIKNIIDKFIGAKNLSKNPLILFVNDRIIDENTSFKDNNIEDGDTILVFKEKEKKRIEEIIIKNRKKQLPIGNFIETQRENSNSIKNQIIIKMN